MPYKTQKNTETINDTKYMSKCGKINLPFKGKLPHSIE